MKQIQKIDKKKAKKDIISALDEYENIILLGFKPTGEAALITATDDEIYDEIEYKMQRADVCEGLEEEIKRWLKEGEITDTRYDDYDDNDIEVTARHFAQWQKGQDEREKHRQEWITETDRSNLNLDTYEYIIKCALDGVTRVGSLCDDDAILDASRLCAKHIKEQLMKEAVEGEVETFSDAQFPEVSIPLNPTMFKVGDKVKIIIVKED